MSPYNLKSQMENNSSTERWHSPAFFYLETHSSITKVGQIDDFGPVKYFRGFNQAWLEQQQQKIL